MPLYDYRCLSCSHEEERAIPMSALSDTQRCRCGGVLERLVSAPRVLGDYEGYTCPVTNKWVEGRAAHRENLKRQGCRVFESGEREQFVRQKEREEATFDRNIDTTVDAAIESMSARKREKLFEEVAAGASANIVRLGG